MTTKVDALESRALKLDPKSRARLAARILRSLETLSEAEIETLWVEEAERRDAELEAGRTKARPAAAVFRRLRSRLA